MDVSVDSFKHGIVNALKQLFKKLIKLLYLISSLKIASLPKSLAAGKHNYFKSMHARSMNQ